MLNLIPNEINLKTEKHQKNSENVNFSLKEQFCVISVGSPAFFGFLMFFFFEDNISKNFNNHVKFQLLRKS